MTLDKRTGLFHMSQQHKQCSGPWTSCLFTNNLVACKEGFLMEDQLKLTLFRHAVLLCLLFHLIFLLIWNRLYKLPHENQSGRLALINIINTCQIKGKCPREEFSDLALKASYRTVTCVLTEILSISTWAHINKRMSFMAPPSCLLFQQPRFYLPGD